MRCRIRRSRLHAPAECNLSVLAACTYSAHFVARLHRIRSERSLMAVGSTSDCCMGAVVQ